MSKKHKHKHKDTHKDTEFGPLPGGKKELSAVQLEKCWQGHPILELGGGVFHGASCIHPHAGYDIYVGLDWGMHRHVAYPWHPSVENSPLDVYFPITDGKIPTDAKEFDAMLDWLADQLSGGKRIHAGCIGGHGRTGLLLVALVHRVTGDKNAGAWVREHYCQQAVETSEQVDFLHKRYGITEFKPSRQYSWSTPSAWNKSFDFDAGKDFETYSYVAGRSVWGASFLRTLT